MEPNLNFVLDQVGKDKGIDKRILVEALEAAMLTAARKRFGLTTDMEARFNEETGEVEVYEFKKIVTVLNSRATEIMFEDAKQLDPELTEESVGDDIGIKVESADFGRIAAQTAKQVIIQRVRRTFVKFGVDHLQHAAAARRSRFCFDECHYAAPSAKLISASPLRQTYAFLTWLRRPSKRPWRLALPF